ncbi:MAG: hypothetical protein KDA32_06520 [Phycisphaerales bacterium]|nr:hypothetical protein [Phycisphaerales bacterium]
MYRKLVTFVVIVGAVSSLTGCVAVSSRGNINTRGDYEAVATHDGIYLVDTQSHIATKVRVVSDEEFRAAQEDQDN